MRRINRPGKVPEIIGAARVPAHRHGEKVHQVPAAGGIRANPVGGNVIARINSASRPVEIADHAVGRAVRPHYACCANKQADNDDHQPSFSMSRSLVHNCDNAQKSMG